MSTDLLPKEAEVVRDWLRHQHVGTVRVVSADVVRGEEASGEPAVFFDVKLAGPPPGQETWPVEDVLQLHERIDREARESGLPLPWFVRLIPERDVEPEPDDSDE